MERKYIDRRQAILQRAVGMSKNKMEVCLRFFDKVEAQDKDLRKLFIKHNAVMEWCDGYTMQLHVKEDTWQIRRGISIPDELWHNSYIVTEDRNRNFTGEFHRQNIPCIGSFSSMVKIMTGYSWETQPHTKEEKESIRRNKELARIAHEKLMKQEEEHRLFKSVLEKLIKGDLSDLDKQEAISYLRNKFNEMQLKEILKGIKQELSLKQVLIFAKEEFNHRQMREIRTGLKRCISMKNVKTYALVDLSVFEMRRKKWSFIKDIYYKRFSRLIRKLKKRWHRRWTKKHV